VTDEEGDDATDDDPAAAFSALAHEVRVETLQALHAHRLETDEETIGFADLRRRVGLGDSGRFRYHLEELRDRFVERTDAGYRLTRVGERVVAAILAGTYDDAVSLGPTALDDECPLCGATVTARYDEGRVLVVCDDDHTLFTWTLPPNAARDAALPAVIDLAELLALQSIEQAQNGVCPQCYDPVDPNVDVDGPPTFRACCDTCGTGIVGPVGFCVLTDAAVRATCREAGLALDERHVWEVPFVADPSVPTATDAAPVRVEVPIALPNDDLVVTLDGGCEVVSLDRQ
jgi:DNA-binding transcriptional ArsR family regulator